jgi:para-aminobenzoate synthetase component 1
MIYQGEQEKSRCIHFPTHHFFNDPGLDFSHFLFLHSGSTMTGAPPHRYPALGGFGILHEITITNSSQLSGLDDFLRKHQGKWIFGHICYDAGFLLDSALKNYTAATAPFPPISFFVPEKVILPMNDSFGKLDQQTGETSPLCDASDAAAEYVRTSFSENAHCTEEEYRQRFDRIRHHLLRGDIYEMNYCLPFSASGRFSNPMMAWTEMQTQQQAPFGALYHRNDQWLMCCSPERWLTRTGDQLLSQPIKGTARRDADPQRDREISSGLLKSEKELAENVMIVDLVRNDLGRIAETGSVQVEELFGLYSFPAVHQLISSISAKQSPHVSFTDILKAVFPMGSMTGAPKISAIKIIAQQETFTRNLYSGSVGYIDPAGNFDFNVVIRSILYDEKKGEALFPAGSAITVHSDPGAEFRECLLKSNSMRNTLGIPFNT